MKTKLERGRKTGKATVRLKELGNWATAQRAASGGRSTSMLENGIPNAIKWIRKLKTDGPK